MWISLSLSSVFLASVWQCNCACHSEHLWDCTIVCLHACAFPFAGMAECVKITPAAFTGDSWARQHGTTRLKHTHAFSIRPSKQLWQQVSEGGKKSNNCFEFLLSCGRDECHKKTNLCGWVSLFTICYLSVLEEIIRVKCVKMGGQRQVEKHIERAVWDHLVSVNVIFSFKGNEEAHNIVLSQPWCESHLWQDVSRRLTSKNNTTYSSSSSRWFKVFLQMYFLCKFIA